MSSSIPDINLDNKQVLANKIKLVTSQEIYNKIYTTQLLEIFKLAISFLLTTLFVRLIDNSILDYYKKNRYLYSILLICLLISVILIASSIFTYLKISNDKNDFLEKLIK